MLNQKHGYLIRESVTRKYEISEISTSRSILEMEILKISLFLVTVSYYDEPHFLTNSGEAIILRHSNLKIEHVGLETVVKPIKIPVFHIGDKVLCVDETSKYYQQVVTIFDIDLDMPFSPYQIDENQLIATMATPFDIVKVNY